MSKQQRKLENIGDPKISTKKRKISAIRQKQKITAAFLTISDDQKIS